MTKQSITSTLLSFADADYKRFHSSLMPEIETDRIIGIRIPVLRKYAVQICGSTEAKLFINTLPHFYYEENNLHGILIEYNGDYHETVQLLDKFLPYVDNWATCDLISPKVLKSYTDELYAKICEWINTDKTYAVRFGIKTLMNFLSNDSFSPAHLELVANITSQQYYVNMARAWYFATALAKQYNFTIHYLKSQHLDGWTHNKTIQKAIESFRIDSEKKEYLKSLRKK
ncbi:MAG: DNA alkylation repair protein [Ruminococcaceae bacterium]|nr:DNA alkylation repair protein [Oscillospiraceae bacterium]